MEVTDKIASFIRSIFKKESEGKKEDKAQIGAEDYNLFMQYGMGNIGDFLSLDHDMLKRFATYEEMDQYPDLSCISGDSLIFSLEHGWIEVKKLAETGGEFYVISYDKNRKIFASAKAYNARKTGVTGKNKRMVKVIFNNSENIKCTEDHLFMTKEEEWIQAIDLKQETKLMSIVLGENKHLTNLNENCYISSVEILNCEEDVYDIEVPKYHNFVCNGVVIHNSALDIYADDATTTDTETNKSIWVECEDTNINDDLNEMLHRKVRAEDDLWEMTRTACKYGNDFEEILVDDGGVQGISYLPPAVTRRISGPRGELLGFSQSKSGDVNVDTSVLANGLPGGSYEDDGTVLFEPWKVVHFRIRAKHRQSPHGMSLLEPARWVFKRLVLMEDAMLIYKLTRAPSRYAYYVDVGDMPPREALAYVNNVRSAYKKRKFVNEQGNLDMKYNPLSQDEDLWLPSRSGKESTRVDVLSGPTYQNIEDVDYMRMKLYAAIKVPRAYLGYEDTISRATLCLSGDTGIPLLDGTTKTIKELHDNFDGNVSTYSCSSDGNIVQGVIKNVRLTRPNAKTIKVTLSNNKNIVCTSDHPFMLINGSYKDAGKLKTEDSLMSFRLDKNGIYKPHTVEKIEDGPVIDTYDLEMDGIPNFATTCGVFVHNSAEDVRFARSIIRVQRVMRTGFSKICRIHLAAKGLDPQSVDFETYMNVPSSVFELAQMEIRTARAELADRMQQWVSHRWILENIFGYGTNDIEVMLKQKVEDALRSAAIEGRQEKLRMGQIPPELANAMGLPPEAGGEVENINKAVDKQDYQKLYRLAEKHLMKNDRGSKNVSADEVKAIIKSNQGLNHRFKELRGLMNEIKDGIHVKRAA